jgi:hypothetical protein
MIAYEKSFWGGLYTSFSMIGQEAGEDLTGKSACVLGASDGKFVIPLAMAGCQVTAVDVDPQMLYGGDVKRPSGAEHVAGLVSNLAEEGVTSACTIVETDYMTWAADGVFDIVITSGSWPYSRNFPYGLSGVVGRMQELTAASGYLFADYLLPNTDFERTIDLYPEVADLKKLFPNDQWETIRNAEIGIIGESHYGQEEWHYHRYGALLMRRRS